MPSSATRDLRRVRNPTLERFLAAPGRFALAGAGEAGEALLVALAKLGLKPHALLDSDRTGRTGEPHGLEILAPEQAVEVALDAVVTAGPFARDMTAQLRADGFEGRVVDLSGLAQGRWASHHDLPSLDAAADAIEFARSLLSDDGSRDVFDRVLAYRRSLDPGDLPPASPPGHPAVAVAAGDQAIQVGIGDPEATLACAEAVGPLGRVHAFEPREAPRNALLDALASSAVGARVSVHGVACGRAGSARATRGDDEGPSRAVGLDEFVWEELGGRIDWIRLSAGSAQGEVLQGAAASLGQRRPRLAVDLHHRPEDLWQLPIRLREQVPAYRLHLGHHSQSLSATVCYARAAR